jgi:hypothetical protein
MWGSTVLTYQLQKRVFRIKNKKEFTFPNDVEIEIYLEPTEQFGVGEKYGKTAVQNRRAKDIFNLDTGKWGVIRSSFGTTSSDC